MSVRQQVGRPTGRHEYNHAWRTKRKSQLIANQRINPPLRLVFEEPVVASVALTEKARPTSFVESSL